MKRLTLIFTLLALTFVSTAAFAQFTQSEMVQEWTARKSLHQSLPGRHAGRRLWI